MTQGRVSHKGNHSVAELDNVVTDSRDGRTLLCPVSQVASLSGVKEGREGGSVVIKCGCCVFSEEKVSKIAKPIVHVQVVHVCNYNPVFLRTLLIT